VNRRTPSGRRSRGRRGPGPWLVLIAALAIPATLLYLVFRWSENQRPPTAVALDTPPPVVDPVDPLGTDLLGFRRVPTVVSRDLNVAAFQDEVGPFLGTLNDRSCAVVSVDGVEVGARNENLAVIPASTQKLLVGAVALEQLGEDFTYTTTVEAPTAPVGGIVDGDLYLVGGGDPLLSSDWYPTSNLERYPVTSPTSLDTLADRVVAAGVTEVTGGVVGDGTRYDDEYFAPGWGVGVAGLESGPYDALMANDSRVLGEELRANDPNVGAAREFARLLRDRGVTIAGEPGSGSAPAASVEVASIESAPLSAVVSEMLGNSDNNTAELVVKELGRTDATPGTREAGLDVVRRQLDSWGVDTAPLVLGDGSGLSLENRATCAALIEVLQRYDLDSPLGQGLPIAGQTGTLSEVFTEHSVAGRLRGKTGTLNNPPFNVDPPAVKALAGYLPVEGGGEVEYALILNGPTISDQSEYRPVWDQLAAALDTYPAGPSPAELGPG
jgi:D-alanyl-D-alanine carboxypeptidase/D-alanyl-D-alanine-endopeptidase (penicillin-binding protein 4)